MNDKRQNTGTFTVTLDGKFLLIQLTYQGKSRHCLLKFDLPDSFSISFTKYHWPSTDKSKEFLEKIIFPYLEITIEEKGYSKEQNYLIIMDTFKAQNRDTLKELCSENNCEIVNAQHNLTNKF